MAVPSVFALFALAIPLIQAEVPLPPTNIRVQCNNLSAKIQFRYEDPELPTPLPYEFHLQYNDDPDEASVWHTFPYPVKILKNDEGIFNVPMHSYAKFAFRVLARNQHGDSVPAYGDVHCTTASTKPASNPRNVHTRTDISSNLIICWQHMPNSEWCGTDFHYLVEYRFSENGDQKMQTSKVERTSNCVTIQNQPIYRQYDIRIWAANNHGRSSVTPVLVKGYSGEGKPASAPSGFGLSPNNSLRGNIAKFMWNTIDDSQVNGKLKRYKIIHWSENDQTRIVEYFGPHETSGSISTLKSNSMNYATISVENSSGKEGPQSNVVRFFMEKGPPSHVKCLQAASHPSGLIKVTWNAPFSFNDVPIGYGLQWCTCNGNSGDKDSTSTCVRSPILAANESDYTILDVESNTDYAIRVWAISASGKGDPESAMVSILTVPQLEDSWQMKPELRSIIGRRYEANITWTIGNGANGKNGALRSANISAFIKYRKQDGPIWRTIPIPSNQSWMMLTDMCPGRIYEITVVHVVESRLEAWRRAQFDAIFRTAEPEDDQCVEHDLRAW